MVDDIKYRANEVTRKLISKERHSMANRISGLYTICDQCFRGMRISFENLFMIKLEEIRQVLEAERTYIDKNLYNEVQTLIDDIETWFDTPKIMKELLGR